VDALGKGHMTRTSVLTSVLSLAMAAGVAGAQNYQNYPQGPPPPPQQNGYQGQPGYPPNQGGYQREGSYQGQGRYPGGGWDTPPQEFAGMRQRGFRDGIEGARRDFENHRPPNVNNRDEFRNPSFIPRPDRREYKMGFRRGYDVGVSHMFGPPRGPRPY
jgi:hypothetical protein